MRTSYQGFLQSVIGMQTLLKSAKGISKSWKINIPIHRPKEQRQAKKICAIKMSNLTYTGKYIAILSKRKWKRLIISK
jgi:hypothetical protein